MCQECNELKQRITELERVVIALTSNQRANELVDVCKSILAEPVCYICKERKPELGNRGACFPCSSIEEF